MADQMQERKQYFVNVSTPDVVIEGRVVADVHEAENRLSAKSGQMYTSLNLRVVVSDRYPVRNADGSIAEWAEETAFYNVTLFGKNAEFAGKLNLKKGDVVRVTFHPARVKARAYSKDDGTQGTSIDVTADNVKKLAWSVVEAPATEQVSEVF